ncbi:DUF4843 domain-containing protein [Paraflavitalea pollutisoli]|uniref:DUF4843 domain-containing protein n=1 Tax=Paraflavitalea pollutisoli TaxID=3034143 RepID=UPI0023ED2E4C|nr:DUF4843 domain-containing protein [Paraflavitalea sp. H1-2-19X]
MKQVFVFSTICALALIACKKTPDFTYQAAKQNVYFDLNPKDSVVFTFAYEPTLAKDTIYLPVKLNGLRSNGARQFGITVVDSNTTAKAGLHYEAFKNWYDLPADTGLFRLPVILLNTDPLLERESVKLTLQLRPGNGIDTAMNKLIKVKILLSNKLEKPSWWGTWPLGAYSQTKHQLFMIATGVTSMTTEGLDAPRNLYLTGRLTVMLADPLAWVKNNPEKGYVATQKADGNYDFYHPSNPAKTILVRKNNTTGRFYFVDEAGLDIN